MSQDTGWGYDTGWGLTGTSAAGCCGDTGWGFDPEWGAAPAR
ncbi:hypothetical protein GCM10017562_01770 [Streptomyces roseofulvus]